MNGLPRLTITAAIAVLLTSLSLSPTVQDATWLRPTILCVAVVAATGYLARRARIPRLLVPVLELAALAVVLVLRFAHEEAIWQILPGRDVARGVRVLVDDGFNTISSYAPPAPVTPGLVFLLAASIGAVAVVVDTIAVTYRSPALAGLPLLVLYAVPVSVVANGVSWLYFGIAAAGWLALLLADGRERLGGWGRRLGTRTFAGDPTANDVPVVPEPLGAVGRRIGIASVALAVVIPAVVPGLGEAVFGRGLGNGNGDGGGTVNTINPYVSLSADLLRPDDNELFTYTLEGSISPDYLRLVSLDTFDGINWIPASLQTSGHVDRDPMPYPPGLDSTVTQTQVTTRVSLTGLKRSTWLPVPYPVTSVAVDGSSSGRWVWDTENRVIWSPKDDVEGLTYSVTSLNVEPTEAQLRDAPSVDPVFLAKYTAMPQDTPAIVKTTAEDAVRGVSTPYEKAVKLQKFFQSGAFTYKLNPTLNPQDPLGSFLKNKEGFCQQFAGTYAAMARTLGLPTRVVVGFVRGDQTQGSNQWTVTSHDTHAWPEVFFENVGWVRFEPTPRSGAGLTQPAYTVVSNGPQLPDRQVPDPTSSAGSSPGASAGIPRGVPGSDAATGNAGATSNQDRFPWVWVLVPLLVAVLALTPWAVRLRQRRSRYARAGGSDPRDAAAAAWAELAATCADLDLAWPASRTPRQVAAALIESTQLERGEPDVGPPAADALRRLAVTTERARYARSAEPTPGLVADVAAARAGLFGWANRVQRLRATFLPVSMLSRVAARTADSLDWVDTAPRRARRALTGRRPRHRDPQASETTRH